MKIITKFQKKIIVAVLVCFTFLSLQAQQGNGHGNAIGNENEDTRVTMCNPGGHTVNVPSQTVANLLNAGWSIGSCATPLSCVTAAGSINCNGGTTTVTVTATGGTSPINGTGNFTVTAGTYTYIVTDANGNTASTSVTVSEPSKLNASLSSTAILCNGGSSTVTISANGGTAPYTGTGIFTVTAGTYTYNVTDASGCSTSTSVTVSEPSKLVASSSATAILCNGGSSTVTVSANGGIGAYTGTGIFTVSAGTYTYNVTDANGCSTSTSVTVSEPSKLIASSSATAILCNGGSSTLIVTAIGGIGAYTGTGNFTVSAGTYTYNVTDANGCSTSTSKTVSEPSKLVASSSATAILCNGGSSTITVTANGGTGAYTGTGSFTVRAGNYTYNVTDANGCSTSTSVSVSEPALLVASIAPVAISPIKSCAFGTDVNIVIGYGAGSASITLNGSAIGGTGVKTYSWSPATGLSNASIANPVFTPTLTSGCANYIYTLTVTDANGCVSIVSTSVKAVNVSAGAGKVKICHATGSTTNPTVEITVSANAVAAHLAHGDCLGSCINTCSPSTRSMEIIQEGIVTEEVKMNIYPNPTDGKFTVTYFASDLSNNVQLTVIDITGKQIYATNVSNSVSTIDLDLQEVLGNAGSGLYLVKIINGANQQVKKINFVK